MDIVKLHAAIVHFALVFPVSLLLIELYYLFTRRQPNGLHALFTYLSFFAVVFATATGFFASVKFGGEILNISEFHVHRALGLGLNILFFSLATLRFLMSSNSSRGTIRMMFTILLLVCVALVLYQGRLGGAVVYDFLLKR